MKTNSLVLNNINTNFKSRSQKKILKASDKIIRKSVNKNMEEDVFVKNIYAKSGFKNTIFRILRDNENLFKIITLSLLALGVVLLDPLILAGVMGLSVANILANQPPSEIYDYEDSVIDPIIDSNLTEEQRLCKSIFLENYDENKAKIIAQKYKQLLSIHSKNAFVNFAFEELKKDYNLQDVPINLETDYKDRKIGGLKGNAEMGIDDSNQQFVIKISSQHNNKSILKSLTHEMHHVKQIILSYQASKNIEERIEIQKNCLKEQYKNCSEAELSIMAMDEEYSISSFMEKIGFHINSLKKGSQLYDYSRKILQDGNFYELKSKTAYFNSFKEIDAIRSSELLMKLVK